MNRLATFASLVLCVVLGFFVWYSWPVTPVVQIPPFSDYEPKYPVRLEIFDQTVLAPTVGTVVRVLDGDTLDVMFSTDNVVRVRLAGIDAPEKRQPYGKETQQYLASLTCTGQVGVYTVNTDRYGRDIAYVFVDDMCLNALLVRQGYAWHYKAYSKSEELAAAEKAAAAAKLNLWSDEKPIPPWDWRDGKR